MPATATRKIAASGSGFGSDAVGVAVEQAVAGVRDPGLVVFFPTCDVPAAAAQAEDAAGTCPVAGMTVSATLTEAGPHLAGCAALAFDESLPTGVGVSEGASADLVAAAHAATTSALADIPRGSPHRLVLLFADTRSGDQAEVVAGAYRVAGPRVPLAGGGAGGQRPAQFAAGGEHRDAVVAVAVGSDQPVGVGVADGCRPVGVPSIVTRAEGRMLLELDGRPAESVYLEKLAHLGQPRTDAEFERFAVLHPLAQPELSGDRRLRHVLGRAGDGALYCATAVSAQAAVEFMVQDSELVAASGRDAVSRALAPLAGRAPAAALIFDCAGRKRALGDDLGLEAQTIRSSFGSTTPGFAGGYTHGEIGRARGAKGDRNHALVVVAIG
jgi:hypothetical protein